MTTYIKHKKRRFPWHIKRNEIGFKSMCGSYTGYVGYHGENFDKTDVRPEEIMLCRNCTSAETRQETAAS